MPDWSENAPVADVTCPMGCDGVRRCVVATVWEAPESAVYQCSACKLVFLHPIMSEEDEREFYEAGFTGYMRERGAPGETQPQEHFEQNRSEGERRLRNLRPYLSPDTRVLEIGSATGFLLAALAAEVASVTGIEPGHAYRQYANERRIRTVTALEELEGERFDLILLYYVVEHLRDPVGYLRGLRSLLAEGGRLALEVPNVGDALLSFYAVKSFDQFYWQKAHYFNYSPSTLKMVLERAGFADVELVPEQRYDISNHIHWLARGEPGGKGRYVDVFDERVNAEYTRALREHWLCDTVYAVARGTGDR